MAALYAADGQRANAPPQAAAALSEAVPEDQDVTVSGTAAQCSAVSSGIRLSVSHLTIRQKNGSQISLLPTWNLLLTTEERGILPGDAILASGKLKAFEPSSNPGQFDLQSHYFRQRTVGRLREAELLEVRRGKPGLKRFLYRVRAALRDSCARILGERQARTLAAVSLGERAWMESEWKTLYQEGGIAHILAISGLHISLAGIGLYRLCRRLGLSFGAAAGISGAAALFYVLMAGAAVSAVRALLMFGLWLCAQVWGRRYDRLTAAALAAAILLLAGADHLGQASFYLSFGAVLSLAVLAPAAQKSCGIRSAAGRTLLSGAAIFAGMLPCVLYFYYQTPLWSTLVNLAVVPLTSVLLVTGLTAAFAGLLSVPVGTFLAAPVHYLLSCFELLCRWQQRLPLALYVAGRPSAGRICAYYGLLLAMTVFAGRACQARRRAECGRKAGRKGGMPVRQSTGFGGMLVGRSTGSGRMSAGQGIRLVGIKTAWKKKIWMTGIPAQRLLWLLCILLCMSTMTVRGRHDLEIICLDVGQGDGALLRLPDGTNCLIDGGSSTESELWRYRIGQAVKYFGIRKLDYIFLSHADRDHISGVMEYLQEYEPGFAGENIHGVTLGCLVLPPAAEREDFVELETLAAKNGIAVQWMKAGDTLAAGNNRSESPFREGQRDKTGSHFRTKPKPSWKITCLSPDEAALYGERNEDSMVLMLAYGQFRMLFTGDLEGKAEQRLTDTEADLRADVLKAGHHGSAAASSEPFLERVRPGAAVISCGRGNRYGHPAPETVERLRQAGARIFETAQCGAVTIRSDGTAYSVEPYKILKNSKK